MTCEFSGGISLSRYNVFNNSNIHSSTLPGDVPRQSVAINLKGAIRHVWRLNRMVILTTIVWWYSTILVMFNWLVLNPHLVAHLLNMFFFEWGKNGYLMLICSSLSTAQLRVTFKFSIGVTTKNKKHTNLYVLSSKNSGDQYVGCFWSPMKIVESRTAFN